MTPERWRQIDNVLGEVLERPIGDWATLLDHLCAGDEDLRRSVEALLNSRADCDDFLDHTAMEVVATPAAGIAYRARPIVGTQIGTYHVVAMLGAGGMGEVYRAHDSRLGRDVAIKVLPELFALDPDRLARFEREAQILGSLNHPNIGAIYGLEEADGVQALVLELVDGPTLADRIAQGPIRFGEALPIARQIVEALEATHEHGIVHRDLKPSNIKLRQDGTIKVLDFGLARATASPERGAAGGTEPRVTAGFHTRSGLIFGTPAYMSPEQAGGQAVDRRTDIWALGCLLYEMLTGRPAFDRGDIDATMAAVLRGEPDWNALPEDVPVTLRPYLRRCVEKDPKQRVQDVGDLRLVLCGAFDAPIQETNHRTRHRILSINGLVARAALAAVLVSGVAAWMAKRAFEPPQPVRRFAIAAAPAAPLAIAVNSRDMALTPDGNRVVFFAGDDGNRQLYVRGFDQVEATPIARGERLFEPFVSPDSRWVGFNDESDFTLKKVSISGGPPLPIVSADTEVLGASWGPDDTVVFARNDGTGLWSVSARDGTSKAITTVRAQQKEVSHRWPEILPGGKAVLFTIVLGQHADAFQIAVVNLETLEQRILVRRGTSPRFSGTGHILFVIEGVLHAVPFDPVRLEVLGAPVLVLKGVMSKPSGAADFAVSRDGSLVYVTQSGQSDARTLVWVDREGHEQPIDAPPRAYTYPRISPDGTRIVLDVRDNENDLWMWDLKRHTFMRLTLEPAMDRAPVWTADGRILFSSNNGGAANLFRRDVDGSGAAERLTRSRNEQFPTSTSPDGAFAVFSDNTTQDLMLLSLNGDRRVRPLVHTRFIEENGEISPDGRWLAYQSNQSGQHEIYVRPFPNVGAGQWQISAGGGTRPLWARSGRELLYVAPAGALMSVPVHGGTTWAAGIPTELLGEGRYFFGSDQYTHRTFDVSPDDRRFVLIKPVGESAPGIRAASIVVVLNWSQELKLLAPIPRWPASGGTSL